MKPLLAELLALPPSNLRLILDLIELLSVSDSSAFESLPRETQRAIMEGHSAHSLAVWSDQLRKRGDTDRAFERGYESGWEMRGNFATLPPPLLFCADDQAGGCAAPDCPQIQDGEPAASGRNCPRTPRPEVGK